MVMAALLVATPAAAQPVTQPRPCQVTISRAPEPVREVVEAWVRSEAQCSVALEVRIVPTDGGLYLLAQDERGRVRERIVPDAQTAGVLVASWIADDNAPMASQPETVPLAPTAIAPPPVSSHAESVAPPGLAPIEIVATAPAAAPAQSKWGSVAALVSMTGGGGGGVRGEIDFWSRGRWTIGAAASLAESQQTMYSAYGAGYITARDVKATALVSRTWSRGRWSLRPMAGIGVIHTEGLVYDGNTTFYAVEGTFPTIDMSITLSRDLGSQWAVYTGPLATVLAQEFTASSASWSYPMTIVRSDLDVVWLAGLRHRL
jgi:hypothetical protein